MSWPRTLWHVTDDPAIFALTCVSPEISLNRRLPGTFQCVLGLLVSRADERSPKGTMGKTGRAVISGSRLFNTVFGLPCNAENITKSLTTFKSGSPPGASRPNPPSDWQGKLKDRPWRRIRLCPKLAPVSFNDRTADRQPYAQPVRLGRIKGFKKPINNLRVQSWT
jgi:hypothetical protein